MPNHKISRNFKTIIYHPLSLLTLLAFLLRIANPQYGSPVLYVMGDEVSNYMSALQMLAEKSWINHTSPYPPLGAYIQLPFLILAYVAMTVLGPISTIADFKLFLVTHEGYFLFIPRILAGVFGSLTIPVVYGIAAQLFPHERRIRLWGSMLMTFSFVHIQTSHFARPWTAAIFFGSLGIYFGIKSINDYQKNFRNLLLSGVFISLSSGFLQAWIYFLFLFVLLRIFRSNGIQKNWHSYLMTIITVIMVVLSAYWFMSLTEYKLTLDRAQQKHDWGIRGDSPLLHFLASPSIEKLPITIGNTLMQGLYIYNFKQLLTQEPVLLIFGLIGIISMRTWSKKYIAIPLYVICLFFGSSILLDYHIRHLLPMWIGAVILAAVGINLVSKKLSFLNQKYVFYFLLLCILAYIPIRWNMLYLRTSTIAQARTWINEHFPQSLPIACSQVRFCGYTPTRQNIELMQQFTPGAFQSAYALHTDSRMPNVRNVRIIEHFSGQTIEQKFRHTYENSPFQYVIDYYWDPGESVVHNVTTFAFNTVQHFSPLKNPQPAFPIANFTNTIELGTIYDIFDSVARPGPYIDILEVTPKEVSLK